MIKIFSSRHYRIIKNYFRGEKNEHTSNLSSACNRKFISETQATWERFISKVLPVTRGSWRSCRYTCVHKLVLSHVHTDTRLDIYIWRGWKAQQMALNFNTKTFVYKLYNNFLFFLKSVKDPKIRVIFIG